MVCCHLEPLLIRLGRGLGFCAEQAGEAVHHKFKKTKARYYRNFYHSKHGSAKKRAVVHWSSWNVYLSASLFFRSIEKRQVQGAGLANFKSICNM